MKMSNIILITKNEFINRFQTELFKKASLIMLLAFGLLVAAMWPGGRTLTIGVPQRFDVGFTILFILSLVFVTQYFSTANYQEHNIKGKYSIEQFSRRELIIGKSLALAGLLFLLVLMLFPHGFVLYCCGYLNELTQLYGITLMMVIVFIFIDVIISLMTLQHIIASIMRLIFSCIYVAGLIYTLDLGPTQVQLSMSFHLIFAGVVSLMFIFLLIRNKNYKN